MTEPAKLLPLTDAEIEELRDLRVCCCEPGCTVGRHCAAPVLDDIGADWIGDHFDSIVETIDDLRRQVTELPAQNKELERSLFECESLARDGRIAKEPVGTVADLTARSAALVEALKSAQKFLHGGCGQGGTCDQTCAEITDALAKAQQESANV